MSAVIASNPAKVYIRCIRCRKAVLQSGLLHHQICQDLHLLKKLAASLTSSSSLPLQHVPDQGQYLHGMLHGPCSCMP